MYIDSLFVSGKVADKSLNFLVDTDCTHDLLFRTVYYCLPAQTRQHLFYGEAVAAKKQMAVGYTYIGALA